MKGNGDIPGPTGNWNERLKARMDDTLPVFPLLSVAF